MLSAPLYFVFGWGMSLVLVILLVLLLYLSFRRRRTKSSRGGTKSGKPEVKLVPKKLKLNAKVGKDSSTVITNSRSGNSFERTFASFDMKTYHRVKKLLEERGDARVIAREERLSLGEVKLIASLSE